MKTGQKTKVWKEKKTVFHANPELLSKLNGIKLIYITYLISLDVNYKLKKTQLQTLFVCLPKCRVHFSLREGVLLVFFISLFEASTFY